MPDIIAGLTAESDPSDAIPMPIRSGREFIAHYGDSIDTEILIEKIDEMLAFVRSEVEQQTENRILDNDAIIAKTDVINALDTFKHALNDSQKIEAIKAVRYMTGMGLKESKDYCESLDAFVDTRPREFIVFGEVMRDGDRQFHEVSQYSTQFDRTARDSAIRMATQAANSYSGVLLVEVLGRTRPVFQLRETVPVDAIF